MTQERQARQAPMLPPGPAPSVTSAPAYPARPDTAAWAVPAVPDDAPSAHPLIPAEAPPQAPAGWGQPPAWDEPAPGYAQQPPPGWVGKWRPPVPPTPTADPSTWPQQGVAPGAGPQIGAWATAPHAAPAVPDDRS